MSYFANKTAIITGEGFSVLSDIRCGSICYGIATAYAKEGANFVITGRDVKKHERTKSELEAAYGIKVLAVPADVTRTGQQRRCSGRRGRLLGHPCAYKQRAGIRLRRYHCPAHNGAV